MESSTVKPSCLPRFNVAGTLVSAVDYMQATNLIINAAVHRQPLSVAALAVHALCEARQDPAYRLRLNSLDLAAPDGQPVRWALNWLHHTALKERVYGPLLMRHVCAAAAKQRLPIFLFGSTLGTLGRLSDNLQRFHQGLEIAGVKPSRFRIANREEFDADATEINRSGARLVFCGLGCPRQENWVHAMRPMLLMPSIAVGAAFALWAGERRMAPAWMQRHGLEWVYRFAQEPRRLFGRYFSHNPRFLAALFAQKFGLSHPSAPTGQAKPVYWG